MPPKIRTMTELARLTARQAEILQQIAEGKTVADAASTIGIGTGTVSRHMLHIGYKLGHTSPAAKVSIALRTGQIRPPTTTAPAPDLTVRELALLRAVARHSSPEHIAQAADLALTQVTTEVTALQQKTGATNRAHLVALAYTWQLLHAPVPTSAASGTPTSA